MVNEKADKIVVSFDANKARQLSTSNSVFWKNSWKIFKEVVLFAADVGLYKGGWDDALSGSPRRINDPSYQQGYNDALYAAQNR
jgi:hypothetical protein